MHEWDASEAYPQPLKADIHREHPAVCKHPGLVEGSHVSSSAKEEIATSTIKWKSYNTLQISFKAVNQDLQNSTHYEWYIWTIMAIWVMYLNKIIKMAIYNVFV